MDFARARDSGYEGRPYLAREPLHFWECKFKGAGQVLAGHVAGSKDEFADGMFLQCLLFEEVITDPLVGSQQNPTVGTNFGQPCFIGSS